MAQEHTEDQVVDAAKELDKAEFTREDVARQLGVEKSDIKKSFQHAKKAGRLVKTHDDESNTGHFKLAD
jgi:predicted transcriptional regulator